MKKIAIVLLMALALVSMATAQAVVSGEFEYGMMTNADQFTQEFDKLEVDINADLDEYNSFSMEIEAPSAANLAGFNGYLDVTWATVTTDWGMLLDLPVGVSTTLGYNDFSYGDEIGVTGWGLEDMGGLGLNKEGAMKVDITASEMISLMAAAAFDPEKTATDTYDMVFGATVNVAPATIIVDYAIVDDKASFGTEAWAGFALGGDMTLDAGGSFTYDMDAETYVYGFGAGFGVAGAVLGVSFDGNDDVAIQDLGFDVNYGLTDEVSADVGVLYDVDGSELYGVDFSVAYAAGAVSYRLGYLYSDGMGGDANYNAESANSDGGVYFNMGLDF